jgi:hypothetical protein
LAVAAPTQAQYDYDAMEWEPGTGYHEEEWYDPGDWFDDDYYRGVDYEETGWGWMDGDAYYDDDYVYYDDAYLYDDDYADWDYYTDEDDTADYDYWDSRRDDDAPRRAGRDRGADRSYYRYSYDDQARDRAQRDRADRQRDRMDRQGDRQRMRTTQLRGELEAWQRKNIQGQRDAHTLVRMTTENGRSAIVNLGPNVDLGRLNLEEDDRVAVRGVRGSIDGRPVLMAQQIRVGDRTIRMNNWQPQQASQQRDRDRQDMRQTQLRGELEAWQRKNLEGQRDAHTLVRMRLENGRSAIVNLGPNVDLARLDLEQGDRITVQGVRGMINGRPVVMAQRVGVGDRNIRMNNWQPRQSASRDGRGG